MNRADRLLARAEVAEANAKHWKAKYAELLHIATAKAEAEQALTAPPTRTIFPGYQTGRSDALRELVSEMARSDRG